MLRLIVYLIIGYIIWKIVRIFTASFRSGPRNPIPPEEDPQDASFRHIQDADFEDISSDQDKPS